MSEETFTNRRGRSVSANADDKPAGDMNESPTQSPKKPPVTPKKPRRRQRRVPRVLWKVLAVIAVLLVVIPLAIGESVRSTYDREVSGAQKELTEIFKDIVEKQKQPLSSESLKASNEKLVKLRDKLCVGGFFDNIASIYPRSKTAYDKCSSYRSQLAVLEEQVRQASEQMKYLEQLEVALESVTKQLQDQFAVLSAQQENWKTFTTSLEQMVVPATFRSLHEQLSANSVLIRDQWVELVQASDALDSAKFSSSRTKLANAYGEFSKLPTIFNEAVAIHQASIIKTVRSIH